MMKRVRIKRRLQQPVVKAGEPDQTVDQPDADDGQQRAECRRRGHEAEPEQDGRKGPARRRGEGSGDHDRAAREEQGDGGDEEAEQGADDAHEDGQEDQDVDGAQPQHREDGGGGGGWVLFLMPALGTGFGAQLTRQTIGIAERGRHLGLGAAGSDAIVEVGLVIRGDLVGACGGQADQAGAKPAKEFLTGHAGSP
jgi:hypothetical protein